jgi:NAD(P)-dependent dehydrogenase (short-subunit alcohol dehydrogenase family)
MALASLSDIQRAVQLLIPQLDGRMNVLICNAGIMTTPPGLSPDGYEIQWATNFLGHALLTKYSLPILTTTASSFGDARIINTTSEGLMLAPSDKGIVFDDLKTKQEYGFGARWRRYGQSKLAQVLYTSQLAQRHPTVSFTAIHPGVVRTDLVSKLGWADWLLVYAIAKVMKPEDGCKNSMWGVTAPREAIQNGAYYSPIAEPGKQTKWMQDEDLGNRLW